MTDLHDYVPFDYREIDGIQIRIWQNRSHVGDLVVAITWPESAEEIVQLPLGCTDYFDLISKYLNFKKAK